MDSYASYSYTQVSEHTVTLSRLFAVLQFNLAVAAMPDSDHDTQEVVEIVQQTHKYAAKYCTAVKQRAESM